MEHKEAYAGKSLLKLDTTLHVDPETWNNFQQLSPAVRDLFDTYPDVAAVELIIHPTPSFSMTSAILIGSPNAWIEDDGVLTSAEDTAGPEYLGEFLWKIGREAGFAGIGPWLETEDHSNTHLVSILLMPNLICLRDAQILEYVAVRTWTDTLSEPTTLSAKLYTERLSSENAARLRAQQTQLHEIYTADLGVNITKGTQTTLRKIDFNKTRLLNAYTEKTTGKDHT